MMGIAVMVGTLQGCAQVGGGCEPGLDELSAKVAQEVAGGSRDDDLADGRVVHDRARCLRGE
jgi:hypothetical protein